MGHGPLILAVLNSIPVEACIDRGQAAKLIEYVFGRRILKSIEAEALGDL